MAWAVVLHGGAGPVRGDRLSEQHEALETVLAWAKAELTRGAAALDVVEGSVRRLEDAAVFIAGRGAHPNTAGLWELDASIMDGRDRSCGGVAALAGVYPPISIARAVMEKTRHVLLAGEGARRFALEQGFAAIDDPALFFASRAPAAESGVHGTVGAVALDQSGAIAAGTSTGGTTGKLPGRVGDSPIIGAGTWADGEAGVSCTGQGEYFIRAAAAHTVATRLAAAPETWPGVLDTVLADIATLGGTGGIIAVNRSGEAAFAFTAEAMRVALATSAGRRRVAIVTKSDAK